MEQIERIFESFRLLFNRSSISFTGCSFTCKFIKPKTFMKLLMVVITAGFFSLGAKAQDNNISKNIFKNKPWEEYKLKKLLQDTLSHLYKAPSFRLEKSSLPAKMGVLKLPLNGVFTGENRHGDEVFAMNTDKMPCLVPNKIYVYNMQLPGIDKTDKNLLPLLKKEK